MTEVDPSVLRLLVKYQDDNKDLVMAMPVKPLEKGSLEIFIYPKAGGDYQVVTLAHKFAKNPEMIALFMDQAIEEARRVSV